MFFYIAIIISLIGLIIATYTDLKERIVTNKLNFGLAIAGLLLYSIQSIIDFTIYPILFSIFGLIFGFSFGWILWKLGVFAGGDVKLFMGLGALNPFTPALLKIGLLTNLSLPIFPITLFLYSLIAFLPYAIFIIIIKLFQKEKERKIIFKELKENSIKGISFAIILAIIHVIFVSFFNWVPVIFQFLAVILISILIQKLNQKTKNILEAVFLITGILLNMMLFLQTFLASAIIILVMWGVIKLLLSSRILLVETIAIKDLKEGMIPQKSLVKIKNKIIQTDGISINKIIKYTLEGKISEIINEKDQIISANKARGLTIEEIKILKNLSKKKLIKNTINIKESMPFVPTMLISYILCLLTGDLLISLLVNL